jgi:hypothetical protein
MSTELDGVIDAKRMNSTARGRLNSCNNPIPQAAPGSTAAIGHTLENSIPLSVYIHQLLLCICYNDLYRCLIRYSLLLLRSSSYASVDYQDVGKHIYQED